MPKLALVVALAAALLYAREADAFELEHTPQGQSVRWDDPSVTFVVDPSIEARVPGGAAAAARAVAAWSEAAGAPELAVAAGPPGGAAAVDGRNTVLLAPDGYEPAGAALAVTVLSYDTDTGALVDADVVVNGIHAFEVLAADARSSPALETAVDGTPSGAQTAGGPFDLEHVLVHEVGHALGLGHATDPGAVMYPYAAPGDASRRAPGPDDARGLEALYAGAAAVPRAACRAASAGGESAQQAGHALLAAALVAVGAAVRRGRAARRRLSP
jgi:hypothetical protein